MGPKVYIYFHLKISQKNVRFFYVSFLLLIFFIYKEWYYQFVVNELFNKYERMLNVWNLKDTLECKRKGIFETTRSG